jgi:predicted ester cyclase
MKTIEQQNTETVTAFIETLSNQSDLDNTDQFFAKQMGEAFPDKHCTVDEIIAQEEKVIARIVMTGTHKGSFAGNPPTGKLINIIQFREFRVLEGKIVEHHGWFDTGFLAQIKAD